MLKKAGIVVATAAAGLLAVSPLAFAGDDDHKHHRNSGDKIISKVDGDENKGLLNGNNVVVQTCDVVDVNAAGGVLALLLHSDSTAVTDNECKQDADTDVNKQNIDVDD